MDIDTRVAGIGVDDQWPSGSETACVLVENNVALIFDELALLVNTVNLSPPSVASLKLDTGTSETGPQGIAGFPGIVMGDLAMDVVSDVSLGNTMCAGGSNPGHNGSEVAKEVTIISRQGTTGKSKLARTIMREERVGVLQEGDQYEPVVDPEVRDKVGAEDLKESKPVDRVV